MKIEAVEVYQYELGYRYGNYVMSGGRVVTTLPSTVVRLITEDGIDGWAETCPLGSTYLAAHADGALAALKLLGPAVLGIDPSNLSAIRVAMDSTLMGHNYAKSPIDIACWDLFGKSVGRPVVDLLGGRINHELPMYKAVPLTAADAMVEFVLDQRSHGVHRFQMKVGADPREDAARCLAVLAATDEGDTVLADANGGWRRQDAIIAARLLEHTDRLFLEQPCPTLEECLLVRQNTNLPMILDEVITDVGALINAAQVGGMEAINMKLNRVGGLTPAKLMRDTAVALGIRMTIEDSWGGDLMSAAVSHLGANTPSHALFAVSFMNDWTDNQIAGYQPRSANGVGSAPTTPGLGVEVDRAVAGKPLLSWKL
jgi:cis-L-3-hydroxyproline dehydratase